VLFRSLAPNLTVLLEAAPVEHEAAIILPCPLLRRTAGGDPVAWLGSSTVYADLPADKPRIVLAHGSVQRFTGWEDEGENDTTADFITVDRILDGQIDYIALGDWHGTKQVGPKAWYSGAPESDRFPKGEDHDAGNILVVDAQRGSAPTVSKESTGKLAWIEYSFDFADDPALDEFEERLTSLLGQRACETLLHLTLSGSLGLKASDHLGSLLDTLEARLLRLKLADRTVLAPTEEEIEALTQGGADPLIARVARRLVGQATGDRHEATGTGATAVAYSAGAAETAAVARLALRELHAAWAQETAR
jgi:DNA repair exonuclease SbcCD nuclease subunit